MGTAKLISSITSRLCAQTWLQVRKVLLLFVSLESTVYSVGWPIWKTWIWRIHEIVEWHSHVEGIVDKNL